jgi:hypothetical protein
MGLESISQADKRMSNQLACNHGDKPGAINPRCSRGLVLGGCLLLLGLLGYLDYVTGYEMSFFVFYSVPVGVAAWWLGRWPAIGAALAATVTWLVADFLSGAKYSSPFFYYWNGAIHFLAFMINAVTIAKIKNDLDRQQALAAELEAMRETLRAVSALLRVCPGCGKHRDGTGGNRESELTALASARPELAEALCADCRTNGVRAGAKTGCPVSSSSSSS